MASSRIDHPSRSSRPRPRLHASRIGWSVALLGLALCGLTAASDAADLHTPRPIAALDSVWLEELTWMEVRDALKAGKTTVIVGTGGIEQNGPYVALGKHNYVLRATMEAIARRLGNALLAPIVPVVPEGSITPPSGHMRYPGTLSLRQETFEALLTDLCQSLKQHGFTDIVLLGDHGDSQRGMQAVAARLTTQWGGTAAAHFIAAYYAQDLWSCDYLKTLGIHQKPNVCAAARAGIHDDYHYEAILATVDPQTIRTEQRLAAGLYTLHGVDMSPLSQTVANGKKLVAYRADLTVAAIRRAIEQRRQPRSAR